MLKIQPNPTFTSKVTIPTPEGPVDIKVTFKHRDTDEYDSFIKAEATLNRSNEDAILDIAEGWSGVDTEFNRENIAALCKRYHAAAKAIVETYIRELTQATSKN